MRRFRTGTKIVKRLLFLDVILSHLVAVLRDYLSVKTAQLLQIFEVQVILDKIVTGVRVV